MPQYDEIVEVFSAPEEEGSYTAKRDWSQAVSVLRTRASVQPDKTYENWSPDRDLSSSRLWVYLPYTEIIESTHRLKWREEWYQIDGPPELWPYGSTRHTRLMVWRAENG
jgi:hypothetical protein